MKSETQHGQPNNRIGNETAHTLYSSKLQNLDRGVETLGREIPTGDKQNKNKQAQRQQEPQGMLRCLNVGSSALRVGEFMTQGLN